MQQFQIGPDLLWRPIAAGEEAVVQELIFAALYEFQLTPDPEGVDEDIINWSNYYAGKGQGFWVLERTCGAHSHLVGSVAIHRESPKLCELRKMYFAQAVRGQGIGFATLTWLKQWALARGYQAMRLETASGMNAALALYQKFGFKPLSCANKVERCDKTLQLDLMANSGEEKDSESPLGETLS